MSRSISEHLGLAALALLAALAAGCEDGRCIRHSDCAPTLSCLATRCVVPPTDADTGMADTAVVDTAVVDAQVADTSAVDVATDGGPSADAAMDVGMDVGMDVAMDAAEDVTDVPDAE